MRKITAEQPSAFAKEVAECAEGEVERVKKEKPGACTENENI